MVARLRAAAWAATSKGRDWRRRAHLLDLVAPAFVLSMAAPHYCHVPGCRRPVAPCFLMCLGHWRRVPAPLQRRVGAAYRRGQERTKDPSPAWMTAAAEAVAAVAPKRFGVEARRTS